MNSIFIESFKLKGFYKSILSYYFKKTQNGISDFDSKIQIIRLILGLESSISFSLIAINSIKKLDIIDFILFFMWFNISIGEKYNNIPIINVKSINNKEREKIIEIAFKEGFWWNIKSNLRTINIDLIEEFNIIGEELINKFKIL